MGQHVDWKRALNVKVLVVGARGIPGFEGGAEKNAEMIFPEIAAREAEVHLFCLNQGPMTRSSYRGVKLVPAPKLRLLRTDKLAYYLYAPFYALWFRPDIVHFQGLGSAILLWLYKLGRIKTVVRYGSADYLVDKWGLLGQLGFLWSEWQLRLADHVIAVTPALAERLRRKGISRNVTVIGNAPDEPAQITAMPNVTSLGLSGLKFALSVGRVTPQKNFGLLIKAFNRARANGAGPDKLVIVGGVDDEDYYNSLKPDLNENVIMTGRLTRGSFVDLLASCSVFVNSSLHEGHSNAVLEAISYDRPLLVGDIPENRDLPLGEHQYFSVTDPEDLSQKLVAVGDKPGDYVVDRSTFSTWEQIAEATFALYLDGRP
jgi:glycosyltransferase involved in cell wall biosynthesis